MDIEFESLKLLPQMFRLIEKLNQRLEDGQVKRWLSVKELSLYLTFGKDKIYKMVDTVFLENEHYYRRENRLIFDREKIDEWVQESSAKGLDIQDAKQIIEGVVASISKK
jgi:hypothetical protein